MPHGAHTTLIGMSCLLLTGAACDGAPAADDDDDSALAAECPEGFIDDDGDCVPQRCGTGPWGDIEVGELTLHVDAASEGGEGTAEEPFAAIAQALERVEQLGEGRLIAVAAGTYHEHLELGAAHAGVELAGRCPELVRIDVSQQGDEAIGIAADAFPSSTAWTVRGITLYGAPAGGVILEAGQLTFRQVDFVENRWLGVVSAGNTSTMVLEDVQVLGTLPDATGQYGTGVYATNGGDITVRESRVVGNHAYGVQARSEGSTIDLESVEIRDTEPQENGWYGYGISVGERAQLTARDCLVADNAARGVLVAHSETVVSLENVEIRDTRGVSETGDGVGLDVFAGATVTVVGSLLEGHIGAGIAAYDEGTMVSLTDVTVRGTRTDVDGNFGHGIQAVEGAELEATGCAVEGNHASGVLASGTGTRITLDDVTVSDTCRTELVNSSIGVVAQLGAGMEATALTVTGTEGPGLYIVEEGSMDCELCELSHNTFAGAVLSSGYLTLVDSLIQDNPGDANLGGGVGIYAMSSSWAHSLEMRGSEVAGHPIAAVTFQHNGVYTLVDNTLVGGAGVVNIRPDGSELVLHGNAVLALDGVTARDGDAGLLMQDNLLQDCGGAALLFDASSGTLSGNTYSGNLLDLLQQDCGAFGPPDGYLEADESLLCPDTHEIIVALDFGIYPDDTMPYH